MASLVSDADKEFYTGALNDHFDTFKRSVTIYKEPRKTYSNASAVIYPGYDYSSQEGEVTFEAVSGVYDAMIIDKNVQSLTEITEPKFNVPKGEKVIKVKQDAREFINNGKTEYLLDNGKKYNITSKEKIQNYLGLQFYYYEITEVS